MKNLKRNEARILVYLENAKNVNRYAGYIAAKLSIDYAYVLQILKKMLVIGWIRTEQFAVKKYYFLTKKSPLEEAKDVLKK